MRILGFIEFTLVIVGAIGLAVAGFFDLPRGVHLGLFLVGAGLALGGLESLFTQVISFRLSDLGLDDYIGTPAFAWGLGFLLVGGAFIASAHLREAGLWTDTVLHLVNRPGGPLVLLGVVATCLGVFWVINPNSYGYLWTLLVRVPKTILGFLLSVAGIVVVVLGLWEAIDPSSFARVINDVCAHYGLSPFAVYWRRLLMLLV